MAAFADATIGELALDATSRVPWWPRSATVTLGQIVVHVLVELARHCGHEDVLREAIDGATGMCTDATSIPDTDWPAYVAKLEAIAERS